MKIKGKIGYVENKNLKGLEHLSGGHYVYINEDNKDGTCNVNVVTSLESGKEQYSLHKLRHVRKGNTYPIPFYDANFSKWSGITRKSINNVLVADIKDIGKKKIKRRHKFYIGKYMK